MDTIELVVNRKTKKIKIDSIMYVETKDKLSVFHRSNGDDIQIFITMGEIENMLPKDKFMRVSRSALVAFDRINYIGEVIYLHNGCTLKYSRHKADAVREKYRKYLANKMHSNNSGDNFTDDEIREKFACMESMPYAFVVMRAVFDKEDKEKAANDMRIVYVNPRFAEFFDTSVDELVDKYFFEEYPGAEKYWLEKVLAVTFRGEKCEFTDYIEVRGKMAHVWMYQPYEGYCAIFFRHIDIDIDFDKELKNQRKNNSIKQYKPDIYPNRITDFVFQMVRDNYDGIWEIDVETKLVYLWHSKHFSSLMDSVIPVDNLVKMLIDRNIFDIDGDFINGCIGVDELRAFVREDSEQDKRVVIANTNAPNRKNVTYELTRQCADNGKNVFLYFRDITKDVSEEKTKENEEN